MTHKPIENHIILTPETLDHIAEQYQQSSTTSTFAGYLAAYITVLDRRVQKRRDGVIK